MKKLIFLLFIVSPTLVFSQFTLNKDFDAQLKTLLKHSVTELSVTQAKLQTQAIFIDTREKSEFTVSHISKAIWCGYNDFDLKRLKSIKKNQKIIVYCSIGYRSEKIAENLIKAGYQDVSNLVGGIFEWKNQGNEVVNSKGKITEKVHAFDTTWGKWLTKGEKTYK